MTGQKAELLQGTLDMLILKAVSLGPLHGYGIAKAIKTSSSAMRIVRVENERRQVGRFGAIMSSRTPGCGR